MQNRGILDLASVEADFEYEPEPQAPEETQAFEEQAINPPSPKKDAYWQSAVRGPDKIIAHIQTPERL